MIRIAFGKRWLACAGLLCGGCGAIPDIIIDEARLAAKEAIQEAVRDAVDDVIEGTVGELLNFDDLEFPFSEQSEDEEDGPSVEDDGEGINEREGIEESEPK